MLKALIVIFLATSMAQIVPSCGGSETGRPGDALVTGVVEAKRITQPERNYTIFVLSTEYDVPVPFWQDVRVGDLVKWDGKVWTIVRRGG